MFKKIHSFIFIVTAIAVSLVTFMPISSISATPSSIQKISHVYLTPGERISVIGYCRGTAAAKGLSAAIAIGGERGFYEYTKDTDNLCFLMGMHKGVGPITVIVKRKAWEVTASDGALFEFWEFTDSAGEIGYTWQNMSVNTVKPTKGREA